MRKRLLFVHLLFFLSGVSALIYQVLWTRMLTLTFGHTVYAVSTVLTSFMAGLALGSYLAGKVADRIVNQVKVYGLLELGIGAYALFASYAFSRLHLLYAPVYASMEDSFVLLTSVRFVIAALLLLVPTTLMGATVPILVKAVTEEIARLGKRSGTLYAINTAGAVCGAVATGFLLIPSLGLSTTNWVAVSINAVIGLLAVSLFRSTGASEPSEATGATQSQRFTYVAAALAGFAALGLEVVWTRALIFSLSVASTTYAFTIMLATFLTGIALGSYLFAGRADRSKNRPRAFALFEFLLGLLSLVCLSLVLGDRIRPSQSTDFLHGMLFDTLRLALLMLGSTLMMGAVFPYLVRHAAGDERRIGREVSRVYAANTLGAILGSFATGFLLIPLLGLSRTAILVSIAAPLTGLFFWYVEGERGDRLRMPAALLVILLCAAAFLFSPRDAFRGVFDRIGQEVCFYREGNSATITMTRGKRDGHGYFYVDNIQIMSSDTRNALTSMKLLAHLPVLLHKEAKSVCTIGFGTGATSYAFTRHKALESIRCVEINKDVTAGASCFPEANQGFLDKPHPRFAMVHDDARAYLENGGRTFDIITLDLANIAYKANYDIYTREFIGLCRAKLNPGGIQAVYISLKTISPKNLAILLRSFYETYGEDRISFWHATNYPNRGFFLLAAKEVPLDIDPDRFKALAAEPEVSRDLASIGLSDPMKLLAAYYMPGRALHDAIEGAALHTVDFPILEFRAPMDRMRRRSAYQNLALLFWQRANPLPPLSRPLSEVDRHRFNHYLDQREIFLKAELEAVRSDNLMSGARDFVHAVRLAPDDRALLHCIGASDRQMEERERYLAANPKDVDALTLQALASLYRQELPAATDYLKRLQSAAPGHPVGSYVAGRIAESQGDLDEAEKNYIAFIGSAAPSYRKEIEGRLAAIALLRKKERTGKEEQQLVRAFLQAGEYDQAERHAEALVASAGRDADNLLWLALIKRDSGRLFEAASILEGLATEKRSDIFYYTGDIYLQLRLITKAQGPLLEAAALDPKNPSIHYALARLYQLADDRAKRDQSLAEAVRIGGKQVRAMAASDPLLAGVAGSPGPPA